MITIAVIPADVPNVAIVPTAVIILAGNAVMIRENAGSVAVNTVVICAALAATAWSAVIILTNVTNVAMKAADVMIACSVRLISV